jgi:RHS repeat-associated protein
MSQVDRPLAVVNGVGTTGVAVWNVSVDHLNRPVLMTNPLTTAMWTAVWQPWGGAHSITGTATLDTRFPGQWYQSETGLHYNWHRSYDPTVGRYTQPDPLGFVDGPSVYGYAKGRPGMLVDPTGRDADVIADALVVANAVAMAANGVRKLAKYCIPVIKKAFSPADPGDCVPKLHRELQDRVNNSCKRPRTCNQRLDTVITASQNISKSSECIDARRLINNLCYRGGDDEHKQAITDAQAVIDDCLITIRNVGRMK